jgi:hypothetical protein
MEDSSPIMTRSTRNQRKTRHWIPGAQMLFRDARAVDVILRSVQKRPPARDGGWGAIPSALSEGAGTEGKWWHEKDLAVVSCLIFSAPECTKMTNTLTAMF